MRLLAAVVLFCFALAGQEFGPGSRIGDFAVEDLHGASIAISPSRGPATVVVFISSLCPVSNAFNDRMGVLFNGYSSQGVQFVFVNANANESSAGVAAHRKSAGFPFPVYKDPGNKIADRFGALSTPESYVVDRTGAVRYHGFIEDSINEARVKKRSLREALDAVLAGKPVPQPETKSFGCTIKRSRSTT